MASGNNQVLPSIKKIIDDARGLYKESASITQENEIPDTTKIPIKNKKHWTKIPDVICVFVDMKGSTALSASKHDSSTARAYQLYTGTAVDIFHDFGSPYIDVRGDGALALFNQNQVHRALAAAVTFKTFAREDFTSLVKSNTDLPIGSHVGIDMKTLLVRKIGLKRHNGRTDRQNEVWAGRPVNMAAKLASISDDNQLLVSGRFHKKITSEHGLNSCGCGSDNFLYPNDLWDEYDVSDDDRFDFDTAFSLTSNWCSIHGREFCQKLMDADNI